LIQDDAVERDDIKAAADERNHGASFEMARAMVTDPKITAGLLNRVSRTLGLPPELRKVELRGQRGWIVIATSRNTVKKCASDLTLSN